MLRPCGCYRAGGHLDAVRFLVQNGQNDLAHPSGANTIIAAVFGGHVEVARFLVEGASKDDVVTDRDALYNAVESGRLDMLRFLKKKSLVTKTRPTVLGQRRCCSLSGGVWCRLRPPPED